MKAQTKALDFLASHNFTLAIADNLHNKILADMVSGLRTGGSDQAMIKAGSALVEEIRPGENAIVIDAGGTNFRSCLVTKTTDGIEISDFQKTLMPAIDRELNKHDFYKAIADNISRLKDRSDKISFCFSYAMAITQDGDGKIIRFSKEVKAPEAVGTYIGKELLKELKIQGWSKIKKINVLNDTTALLLSTSSHDCKSRIAFILGTGMNSAFVYKKRIIVTECGMFSNLPQSDFDITVCSRTSQPKQSLLEKMSSGAYLGELAYKTISQACKEELFSKPFINAFKDLKHLATADFDGLYDTGKESSLSAVISKGDSNDLIFLKEIITAIIERAAYLTAEAIYAALLMADEDNDEFPVCIACNGSTFWKTPMLKEEAENRLKKLLSAPFEIVKIDDDITKGSFAAAFIK